MKLSQVISENVLLQYNNAAGPTLTSNNPGNPDGSHVIELKRALNRHTVVTGKDQQGNYQTAGPAWSGPIDKTWDVALDTAIKTWKRSINIQVNNPRELNPATSEIAQKDIRYLIRTKLVEPNRGSMSGLLDMGNAGTEAGNQNSAAMWGGTKVSLDHVINTPVNEVIDTPKMIAAIGFSGWYFILQELLNKREAEMDTIQQTRNARLTELNRMMIRIPERQNQFGSAWLENVWKGQVVQRMSNGLVATLANGEEMSFVPPMPRGGMKGEAQALYSYFKQLADGLIQKFKQQETEREAAADRPQVQNDPTLGQSQISAWITAMNQAFKNSVLAAIPGGRLFSYDGPKIQQLMNQLNTAGDWNKVDEAYNTQFEDLSTQLVDELSEEDYQSMIVRRLTTLRRINPRLLYASIIWGQDETSMTIDIDDQSYTLEKQLAASMPVVNKGRNAVKDVLVIDEVLKAAIQASGGSVPDLNVEANDEHRAMAGAIVTTAISDRAPEMTAFYTMQDPFDTSQFKSIGPRRLAGILNEAAVLIANGSTPESVGEWAYGQVMDDRLWLVGDGTENNVGAANIHFDTRYRDESDSTDGFGSSDDDVELTADETDFLERLGNPQTRDAALQELSQIQPDTELRSMYDKIYRAFGETNQWNPSLDSELTDNDGEQLLDFILSEPSDIPEGFISIINKIGTAYAAPTLMAVLFHDSMNPLWFGWSTNDETLDALVSQIRSKDDYLQINERYKAKYGGDLIDDIDSENIDGPWSEDDNIEKLKSILGMDSDELARSGNTTSVQRALEQMREEPTPDNIENLKQYINDTNFDDMELIVYTLDYIDTIVKETLGATDEQQAAFLEVVEDLAEQGEGKSMRAGGRSGITFENWFAQWRENKSNTWFI